MLSEKFKTKVGDYVLLLLKKKRIRLCHRWFVILNLIADLLLCNANVRDFKGLNEITQSLGIR